MGADTGGAESPAGWSAATWALNALASSPVIMQEDPDMVLGLGAVGGAVNTPGRSVQTVVHTSSAAGERTAELNQCRSHCPTGPNT